MVRETLTHSAQKAHKQTWGTPQRALKWLLKFAEVDIPNLTPEAVIELRLQVYVFGEWGLPITIGRRRSNIPFSIEGSGGVCWGEDGVPAGITTRHLRILQTKLQEHLRDLRLDGKTAIPIPATTMKVISIPKAPGSKFGSQCLLNMEYEQEFTGFWFNVSFLLGCFGGMIRQCSRCRKTYYAERERQAYCGHACQNAATQQRHRERVRALKASKRKKGIKNRKARKTGSCDC